MNSNKDNINFTRRNFIQKIGACSAAGALLCLTNISESNAQALYHFLGDIPLDKLDYSIFSELEGDHFTICVNQDEKIVAQLVEAKKTTNNDNKQEGFSLLFEADSKHCLEQQTYDFKHPTIGKCSIFIVPVGSNDKTVQYEAVFNRLLV